MICIQAIENEADRDLVEELYRTYCGVMLSAAWGVLKDQTRAEDAVSRAFVKIIDDLQTFSFKDCNKTKGFLVIMVRNICYDLLREEMAEKAVAMDDLEEIAADEGEAPPEYVISEESCEFVLSCISELGSYHKDIIRLKLLYGYTDEELAALLDISPGNVRVRLHRARKALAKIMRERGVVDG